MFAYFIALADQPPVCHSTLTLASKQLAVILATDVIEDKTLTEVVSFMNVVLRNILWIWAYLPTHEKLHYMVFVFSLSFLFAVVLFRFRAGRHLPPNCCPSLQLGRS